MELLLVEDDVRVRRFVRRGLEAEGYCVTAAQDGIDGLHRAQAESYDVVILDVMLPGLSGREILKCVQDKHPTTPVIVISGASDKRDAEELLELGAFAYLAKPFELIEIEEAANRAIARHKELMPAASASDSAPLSVGDDSK